MSRASWAGGEGGIALEGRTGKGGLSHLTSLTTPSQPFNFRRNTPRCEPFEKCSTL